MISIIVAMDKNNLIGNGNDLPWHYPEDLRYFKKMTLNKTVLMGKVTFESIVGRIGMLLPKRHNIVASLDSNFQYSGVEVINNLISFLSKPQIEEIFIIGGRQIYQLALPYADRLYITHIDKEYSGDVFFPEIDYTKYNVLQEEKSGDLTFAIYERK